MIKIIKVIQRHYELFFRCYTSTIIILSEIHRIERASLIGDSEINSIIYFKNGKKIKVCDQLEDLEDKILERESPKREDYIRDFMEVNHQ